MVGKLRLKLSTAQHPDLLLWGCFFVLNFLLFLPFYVFNRDTTALLPLSPLALNNPTEAIMRLALWRNNLDPFSLNGELTLLTALWVNIR